MPPDFCVLTLKAISIEQILAFLMTFHPTLRTAYPLSRQPPQQTLTLKAVGGRRC